MGVWRILGSGYLVGILGRDISSRCSFARSWYDLDFTFDLGVVT